MYEDIKGGPRWVRFLHQKDVAGAKAGWIPIDTMWGPRSIAWKIGEHNSNFTMVYGTYNELVAGAYKPTNITGGPHIVLLGQPWLYT